jgi:hypothetical protein
MDGTSYPVSFSVDYPDRELDRVTSFFRIFTVIPIGIVLGAVAGGTWEWSYGNGTAGAAAGAGGLLFFGPLLMLLFRQKYPRWWFDWNLELQRFSNRVLIYLALMDDVYPSTDDHQSVHLDYPYPDAARDLNRWLPLIKWLLAIPITSCWSSWISRRWQQWSRPGSRSSSPAAIPVAYSASWRAWSAGTTGSSATQ